MSRRNGGEKNPRPGATEVPVEDQEYLDTVTGKRERKRHTEQLERQEEHQDREDTPRAPGGRPGAVTTHRGPVLYPAAPEDGDPATGARGAPLPGGINHVINRPAPLQDVTPKGHRDYYRGIMTHGVPPTGQQGEGGTSRIADPHLKRFADMTDDLLPAVELEQELDPIAVYLVERAGGPKSIVRTSMNTQTLPVAGGDPQRIIGQDLNRRRIALLNEDSTHHARIDTDLGDLARGRGAILPAGQTSYLWLESQDQFFGVSNDSSTVKISFICVYEVPGGG